MPPIQIGHIVHANMLIFAVCWGWIGIEQFNREFLAIYPLRETDE